MTLEELQALPQHQKNHIVHHFREAALHRARQWDAERKIEAVLKEASGDEDAEINVDFGDYAHPISNSDDPDTKPEDIGFISEADVLSAIAEDTE